MASTQQLILPDDRFRLEEINMTADLAATLAGRTVAVKVLPEVPSRTLRIDLDNPAAVGVSVLVNDNSMEWPLARPVCRLCDSRLWGRDGRVCLE